MKIQLKGLTAELTQALKKAKIDPRDFYCDTDKLNELFSELSIVISLDWCSTDCDNLLQATYYSMKLRKSIIIDWDFCKRFDSYEEMAGSIIYAHGEARKLEASISVKKTNHV